MRNLPLKVLVLWCCGLCAGGCTARAGGGHVHGLPLRVLYQDALCGGSGPAAAQVTGPEHLTRIISEAGEAVIGRPPKAPAVDFAADNVVLIRMGQQPTGGYGIELAEPQARLENGAAMIRLRWIEPVPGTVSTQALTSPCLIVELPKGTYRKIVITDESGKIRGEISVGAIRD
ncbi:MAG: protease complex subunit PrcB family protein [Desulfobacterales bacterium]